MTGVQTCALPICLVTTAWLAGLFVNFGFLAIIIIFQPEIRNLLEKLGKTSVFTRISTLTGGERERLVNELVKATALLSDDKVGALITIEQASSLQDYIRTGSPMNSMVTSDVLRSLFSTNTPLHDGAVIIQGDRIACASAYFPPTSMELPTRFGARHRAALGISEVSDAITIVVSEETGRISISENGVLYAMSKEKLREYLSRVIIEEENEIEIMTLKGRTNDKNKEKPEIVNEEDPVTEVATPVQRRRLLEKIIKPKQESINFVVAEHVETQVVELEVSDTVSDDNQPETKTIKPKRGVKRNEPKE